VHPKDIPKDEPKLKNRKLMKKLCFWVLLSLVAATGCSKDDDLGLRQDITGQFDPFFAQELQKRGYVADARHITPAEVMNIKKVEVAGIDWEEELPWYERGELTSLRGIEYFISLTYLDCGFNQLTSLDISKNKSLDTLLCWYNQLTSLDVSKNTLLKTLMCGDNKLTSLDLSQNTALISLCCDHNQLTTLDVSKNTVLIWLSCFDNQLTTLDVSKNMALTWFFCHYNPGDGSVFPVTAWFDNNSIPNSEDFTTGSWSYNGKTVRIDYRKAD